MELETIVKGAGIALGACGAYCAFNYRGNILRFIGEKVFKMGDVGDLDKYQKEHERRYGAKPPQKAYPEKKFR